MVGAGSLEDKSPLQNDAQAGTACWQPCLEFAGLEHMEAVRWCFMWSMMRCTLLSGNI